MMILHQIPDKLRAVVWSIEFLVLVVFFFQSFLAFYGSTRRHNGSCMLRAFVWFAYLLSAKFPTAILGRLTSIPLDGNYGHTRRELLALLAPLILMLIGNPDAITAYSLEDDQLGGRQIFSLSVQILTAIYVISRSWTSLSISYLYLTMFLAGIIKYGEAAWALKMALHGSSGSTIKLLNWEEDRSSLLKKLPERDQGVDYMHDANLILRAYQRFFQLKPHLQNWLYRPLFKSEDEKLSIYELPFEEIFRITDYELGFMYDVLYTKAPIVYSRTGCILRIISFFSLIATLCGFIVLFKDDFVYDVGVGFLYFLLVASVILEIFQILLLPFSDWVIIMMMRHYKQDGVFEKFLKILVPHAKRRRRWSNSLKQFNLLSFCMQDRYQNISRWNIFRYFGTNMMLRKLRNTTTISINSGVKELIAKEMKIIERNRKQRSFVKVGKWTMERYGIKDGDLIKKVFGNRFGKCIITWHVATEILYHSKSPKTKQIESIRTISNYMMYLLARKPQVLRTTTAAIVFDRAMPLLEALVKTGSLKPDKACEKIIHLNNAEREKLEKDQGLLKTRATKGWSLLKDVKDLVERLEESKEKWELIGSAWIEMMCYAASNCEVECHSEHLWQGGEWITHIWLLLAHNTDKNYNSRAADQIDNLEEPTSAV